MRGRSRSIREHLAMTCEDFTITGGYSGST